MPVSDLSFDDLIPQQPQKKRAIDLSFDDLLPKEDPGIAQTLLIGAGRTGDKIVEGVKQLGLSAKVAAKEAVGMNSREDLQNLAAMDRMQQSNDTAYRGLQQQHPFASAVGETLPALAIPMGQATALGRIAAPALGMAGMEAVQYGDPKQRALKGAGGLVSGLAGGALGEGVARTIMPIRDAMGSGAQEAAKAAAAKIGAPLLPSQMTGNATMARIEDALARAPGSAGVMQDFLQQQKSAVGTAAAGAIRQPGDMVSQAVQDTAKADMGRQYDTMRAAIPNGLPASQPVFDAIDRSLGVLTRGSQKVDGKPEAIGLLNELKDKLYATKALTPEEYTGWVSDIASAARSSKNDTIKGALKAVGSKMDEVARGPLNKEWQQLDQSYAALKTLQKSGAVNPETGDIAMGRLSTYMRNHPSGANATSLKDVKAFADAVPQLRAGSPSFERGEVGVTGALNALWRYPAAKLLTSGLMRDYLAKGLLASPEASRLIARGANQSLPPLAAAPAMGLLSPYYVQ